MVKNEKRTKHNFYSNLDLPEYHLYENIEKYKLFLWEEDKFSRDLSKLDHDDVEDKSKI